MLVKFKRGKLICKGDLQLGDIVQGYIQFGEIDDKGKVVKSGGFIADDKHGHLFAVSNGKTLMPFFKLREAEAFAEKVKKKCRKS